MADGHSISEAFLEIVKLAERLSVAPISQFSGCWEHRIDERWWIAVNGHKEPVACSAGTEVPAFSAYVQFDGWPAGIINPRGGTIMAGEAANEDSFIAALKASDRNTGDVG